MCYVINIIINRILCDPHGKRKVNKCSNRHRKVNTWFPCANGMLEIILGSWIKVKQNSVLTIN